MEYNSIDKTIKINDGLKRHYFIVKILMILNLINSILNLLDVNSTGIRLGEVIWLVLGIISIIVLYFYYLKKSALEIIPIANIKRLKEDAIFGKKHFSLELNNGKKRDLADLKTDKQIKEVKKLFATLGIQNK